MRNRRSEQKYDVRPSPGTVGPSILPSAVLGQYFRLLPASRLGDGGAWLHRRRGARAASRDQAAVVEAAPEASASTTATAASMSRARKC